MSTVSSPAPSRPSPPAPLLSPTSWHSLLSHPDGRDRLFRLLQYLLKLLRGISSPPPHALALEQALGAARQTWRLFKWSGLALRASQGASPTLSAAQDACLAAYLALDNLCLLTKLGAVGGDAKAAARRAARAWFATSVLGLVGAVRRCRLARQQKLRGGGARDAALAVKYAGDAVVAFSLSRTTNDGLAAHPGVVGACGLASSLVMLSDVWPRLAVNAG